MGAGHLRVRRRFVASLRTGSEPTTSLRWRSKFSRRRRSRFAALTSPERPSGWQQWSRSAALRSGSSYGSQDLAVPDDELSRHRRGPRCRRAACRVEGVGDVAGEHRPRRTASRSYQKSRPPPLSTGRRTSEAKLIHAAQGVAGRPRAPERPVRAPGSDSPGRPRCTRRGWKNALPSTQRHMLWLVSLGAPREAGVGRADSMYAGPGVAGVRAPVRGRSPRPGARPR